MRKFDDKQYTQDVRDENKRVTLETYDLLDKSEKKLKQIQDEIDRLKTILLQEIYLSVRAGEAKSQRLHNELAVAVRVAWKYSRAGKCRAKNRRSWRRTPCNA